MADPSLPPAIRWSTALDEDGHKVVRLDFKAKSNNAVLDAVLVLPIRAMRALCADGIRQCDLAEEVPFRTGLPYPTHLRAVE